MISILIKSVIQKIEKKLVQFSSTAEDLLGILFVAYLRTGQPALLTHVKFY